MTSPGQPLLFDSTVTLSSKTPGFEEVRYTIKRFTHGRRARLRLQLSGSLDKIRDLTNELDDISTKLKAMQKSETVTLGFENGEPATELDVVSLPEEEKNTSIRELLDVAIRVSSQIDTITMNEVDPAYLRIGLVKIEGIKINGAEPTADLMYEDGPEDLCKEIIFAIKKEAGVEEEVKESLESPSTSGAVVDGGKNSMTAPLAGSEVSTEFVIV